MNDITETKQQNTETKQQKFVRLANKRVERALKDIALIASLSSSSYSYSEEQALKIIDVLESAVTRVKLSFNHDTTMNLL